MPFAKHASRRKRLRIVAQHRVDESRVPITLVSDNAGYQKCNLVAALSSQLNVQLLLLPAYSPKLNLIEIL